MASVKVQAFERALTINGAGLLPEEMSSLIASTAKQALRDAITGGEADEGYRRIVDQVEGAPEDAVRPDGYVLYEFQYLSEIAEFALTFCRHRSPEMSGRYKGSWFVMVNGAPIADLSTIPAGAEVVVTNDQPYHRKIEVGAMKMRVPPHIVEDCRRAVFKRFGNFIKADVRFITLPGGYVLKGGRRIRKRRTAPEGEKAGGKYAGSEMTYPALVIYGR